MSTDGPYARAAWAYREAGWRGVLPLPVGTKGPPPRGFTGWAGVDPSGADVQAWLDGPEGAGNVALRLPVGVYGLDVDAYGAKMGGRALTAAVERLGPLPATWQVTARDDGVSGIRLFRAGLAPGRRWRDEPAGHGAGIEAIHFGHRYAVVAPSVHPDTGTLYRWYPPEWFAQGESREFPRPDGLPELPAAWIEALSEPGEVRTAEAASHGATLTAVTAFLDGDTCDRVREAAARAIERLRAAQDGAALHPAGRDATHELVALGHEGHTGARRALAEHFGEFVALRVGRGTEQRLAEGEWWRLVRGAVGKLASPARAACDCALLAGEAVQFDPEPYIPRFGYTGVGPAVDQRLNALASENPIPPGISDPEGGEGGAGGLVEVLLARMLTPAQLRDRPPPAWLIEGLLHLDSVSWLIAEPGSYKSFVALDWAGHVGAGKPWLGRSSVRGAVVYVVAEGAGGMGPRIRAWEQRNGPMAPEIHFLPMPVQAAREDHWAALVQACRLLGPRLIILDTQARMTVGLNENDNSEMGTFIEAVEELRRATGACVLTVHHLGRGGQHARGASAIDGAQDTELRLTRTADRRATLVTDKSKNAADDVRVELELFLCELDDGGTSLVIGPALVSATLAPDHVANLPTNQAALVQIMIDVFPEVGGTKPEVKTESRKRPRRAPDGAVLDPMGESAFRRAWDALVGSGRFERVHGTQRYVLNIVNEGVSE